jgi:anti-sigma regulatory factor (Ser/Thr protein kinase)
MGVGRHVVGYLREVDDGELTDVPPSVDPASQSVTAEASTPNDLTTVRQRLAEMCDLMGLDGDRTAALAVAVNEIITNALTHGVPPATITMSLKNSALLVAVHDRGTTQFGHPDIDARLREAGPPGPKQLNGRGLWLAAHLCDRVDAQTIADGTTVTLVVNL